MLGKVLLSACPLLACPYILPADSSVLLQYEVTTHHGQASLSHASALLSDHSAHNSTLAKKLGSWHAYADDIVKKWQASIVGVVMLLALVSLITELFPPSITMLFALCLVWNMGILTNEEALQGFSNNSLVVVGSMFVVIKGVDRSKLIDRTARSALGARTSQFVSLFRLLTLTCFFGCFINNAPLVGLFMPIVRDWARARDFAPSQYLMPLSFASVGGGTLTLIGTSTNLVINGMMIEDGEVPFSFFDPARVGVLQNIFTMLFILTLGRRLLPVAKGGLFRTLREHKEDMVTELQVMPNFPLVGTTVSEVVDGLGIPRDAVLKIFRRPLRKAAGAFSRQASPSRTLQRAVSSQESERRPPLSPSSTPLHQGNKAHSALGFANKPTPFLETPPRAARGGAVGASYMERTADYWGRRSRRSRAATEGLPPNSEKSAPVGRLRTLSSGDLDSTYSQDMAAAVSMDPGDPDVCEVFPVLDPEVVLAGDVLLLSLPREACVDFVDSSHVAKLLSADDSGKAAAEGSLVAKQELGLRMCDMDLLELPGKQGEYVELVLSQSNPFVGIDFTAEAKRRFEEQYQVAVLAVRQKSWGVSSEESAKGDLLLSMTHRVALDDFGERESNPTFFHSESPSEGGVEEAASGPCLGSPIIGGGTTSAAKAERGPYRLRQGDAVLVLAKVGGIGQQFPQDFLAQTKVAHEIEFVPTASDYIPLVLFTIGIVLVATQQASMVQVSMALAAIYMMVGWVSVQEMREDVDWNMLMLIGSALGLAKAVQASGLSGAVASIVKNAKLGKRGTVFVLYFFTMLITELVTNNAAAALAFPLAADISREMGLKSVKPLAMTVMLATSACYMNPIGCPQHLMVMGPGGYTFKDFVKVGFFMDMICWITSGIFIPLLWSMEEA